MRTLRDIGWQVNRCKQAGYGRDSSSSGISSTT